MSYYGTYFTLTTLITHIDHTSSNLVLLNHLFSYKNPIFVITFACTRNIFLTIKHDFPFKKTLTKIYDLEVHYYVLTNIQSC